VKVRFTKRAADDLERIGDAIARDNPSRALSFITELRNAALEIKHNPLSFSSVQHRPETGLRRKVHGNYLIFFKVAKHEVIIIRLLHGAMDHQSLLFSER
jgi:toxin ParE1/3/4